MSAVEEFLKNQPLFKCERMNATISQVQCDINRNGRPAGPNRMAITACLSCEGCPGLGEVSDSKEDVVTKSYVYTCKVKGCDKRVQRDGMCYRHLKAAGINPAGGLPLASKVKAVPVVKQAAKQMEETDAGQIALSTICDVCGVVPCDCSEDAEEVGVFVDGRLVRFGEPSPEPSGSAMARELDLLFSVKRTEWLLDLAGATTERSRAKMFLGMADSLEGLAY